MPDLSYTLFDTIVSGTAVFDSLYFQTAQGADATHTEVFTNMRGAGSLPSTEKFVLEKLVVAIPPSITPADEAALFVGSVLQFRLLNQILLWIPLQFALGRSGYNSFFTLAAAATSYASGFIGDGYKLENAITIGGGEKFDVRVKTTVATAASWNVFLALYGVLSLP